MRVVEIMDGMGLIVETLDRPVLKRDPTRTTSEHVKEPSQLTEWPVYMREGPYRRTDTKRT